MVCLIDNYTKVAGYQPNCTKKNLGESVEKFGYPGKGIIWCKPSMSFKLTGFKSIGDHELLFNGLRKFNAYLFVKMMKNFTANRNVRSVKQAGILFLLAVLIVSEARYAKADDGYRMWLRYDLIENTQALSEYRSQLTSIYMNAETSTMEAAFNELNMGLSSLLGVTIDANNEIKAGSIIAGTPVNSDVIALLGLERHLARLGSDGYLIRETEWNGNKVFIIAANNDIGVLYGIFGLLRKIQTNQHLNGIEYQSQPKVRYRIVNHWDNLNRRVERGYAGLSLWEWGTLPEYKNPRYTDYARINASIGINAAVINNVNADPRILTSQFLEKSAVLADIFRPYGIQLFLSINFHAPVHIGGLESADPLDPDVIEFWKDKTEEIYSYIPDFGGFLVKADSEGQPGPHGYGRDHAQGANMLAEALEPYGGIVLWRAFVYDPEQDDRFREAYDEFVPLDGKFNHNVILQIKNGPIDFQPREPFSPLFGALPRTNTILELQITQEYFGFNLHLAYQGTLFREVLDADTYAKGEGSTVAKVVDGSVFDNELTGMAGVINPGTDRNWTGHPFVQSSWYAFGRLAWDHTLSAEEIAEEWIRMTFSNNSEVISSIKQIMMISREAGVNYRNPLGLTHLYAQGHHYGPAPWHDRAPRKDWTSVYYHRATTRGIGFDRTETGSNAVQQYHEPVAAIFSDLEKVPEKFLLWFHHVNWDHTMLSGRTLWEELVYKYYIGVDQVRWMRNEWEKMKKLIDKQRFEQVKALLEIQERDAVRWRDSCVLYFQTFSNMPIPEGYELPEHNLSYYMSLEHIIYVPDHWYGR